MASCLDIPQLAEELRNGSFDLETVLLRLRLGGATVTEIAQGLQQVGYLSEPDLSRCIEMVDSWCCLIGLE